MLFVLRAVSFEKKQCIMNHFWIFDYYDLKNRVYVSVCVCIYLFVSLFFTCTWIFFSGHFKVQQKLSGHFWKECTTLSCFSLRRTIIFVTGPLSDFREECYWYKQSNIKVGAHERGFFLIRFLHTGASVQTSSSLSITGITWRVPSSRKYP